MWQWRRKQRLTSLLFVKKKKIRFKIRSTLVGLEIWELFCTSLMVLTNHNLSYPNKRRLHWTTWRNSWFIFGEATSCVLQVLDTDFWLCFRFIFLAFLILDLQDWLISFGITNQEFWFFLSEPSIAIFPRFVKNSKDEDISLKISLSQSRTLAEKIINLAPLHLSLIYNFRFLQSFHFSCLCFFSPKKPQSLWQETMIVMSEGMEYTWLFWNSIFPVFVDSSYIHSFMINKRNFGVWLQVSFPVGSFWNSKFIVL